MRSQPRYKSKIQEKCTTERVDHSLRVRFSFTANGAAVFTNLDPGRPYRKCVDNVLKDQLSSAPFNGGATGSPQSKADLS